MDVHSNVHVGELRWGTDPRFGTDTPDPTLRVEVDYHDDNTTVLQNGSWRESIEKNYALYGINVTFLTGGNNTDYPSDADLQAYSPENVSGSNDTENDGTVDQPFTHEELNEFKEQYTDTDNVANSPPLYMIVANVSNETNTILYPGQSGIRWNGDDPPGQDRDDSEWIAVFAHGIDSPSNVTLNASPDLRFRAAARKAAVHELGHVLNMGEADDRDEDGDGDIDEIYSGGGDDFTEEFVEDSLTNERDLWSVMTAGLDSAQYIKPMNGTYFPFSIQELLTASTEDTQVETTP